MLVFKGLNSFDFIIIGAGAAGSIVAARLAECGKYTVLLLEAGQDNRQNSKIISEKTPLRGNTEYAKSKIKTT